MHRKLTTHQANLGKRSGLLETLKIVRKCIHTLICNLKKSFALWERIARPDLSLHDQRTDSILQLIPWVLAVLLEIENPVPRNHCNCSRMEKPCWFKCSWPGSLQSLWCISTKHIGYTKEIWKVVHKKAWQRKTKSALLLHSTIPPRQLPLCFKGSNDQASIRLNPRSLIVYTRNGGLIDITQNPFLSMLPWPFIHSNIHSTWFVHSNIYSTWLIHSFIHW